MIELFHLGRLDRRADAAMDRVARRLVAVRTDEQRGRLYGLQLRDPEGRIPVHTPQGRSAQSSAAFLKSGSVAGAALVKAFRPMMEAIDRMTAQLASHPLVIAAAEAERMRAEREGANR